jgi:membrane protease YdiL (CAAX protease family)
MTVAAVLAVLVVHNLGGNLWVADRLKCSEWLYVPLNLAVTALIVVIGGVDISLGRAEIVPVVAVLAGVAVLAVWRPRLFADRRMAGVDARGTAWQVLVRIPLGTVVLEEVAFRGVLPELLSPVAASVLFGLWHVVPTVKTLDINGLPRSPALVGGAVAATTVVGLVLCWLAAATGGVLAPALVHAAANGGAVVASYVVLRSAAGQEPAPEALPHEAAEQGEEEAS